MKLWQKTCNRNVDSLLRRDHGGARGSAKAENFKCQIAAAFRVGGSQGDGRWAGAEAGRAALDWIPHPDGGQRTNDVLL